MSKITQNLFLELSRLLLQYKATAYFMSSKDPEIHFSVWSFTVKALYSWSPFLTYFHKAEKYWKNTVIVFLNWSFLRAFLFGEF